VLDDLKVAIDGARLYPCEAQVAVLSDLFGRERRKRQRRKGLTHDRVDHDGLNGSAALQRDHSVAVTGKHIDQSRPMKNLEVGRQSTAVYFRFGLPCPN